MCVGLHIWGSARLDCGYLGGGDRRGLGGVGAGGETLTA